jgi:hypothetical protein
MDLDEAGRIVGESTLSGPTCKKTNLDELHWACQ